MYTNISEGHLVRHMYRETYKKLCWFMAQEVIFVFLSLTDIACVRALGDDALIGVSFATTVYSLMFNLHIVFTHSLRVIQARYFGANDTESVKSALTTATLISGGLALAVTLVYILFGKQLLGLSALTPDQLEVAHSYLMWRLPGYVVYAFTNGIPRTIEASGQIAKLTKIRICNIINVPLNFLFIPIMGAAGAAFATDMTETTELIILLIVFKPKFGKPRRSILKEVLRYGLTMLPKRFISPVTNTILSNMWLQFLSPTHIVILQVADAVYYQIQCILGSTVVWVETEGAQAYGEKGLAGLQERYSIFKHCYIRLVLWHIPATLLIGLVYMMFIAPVSNIVLAMMLLLSRIAVAILFYMPLSGNALLRVVGILKPVMWARLFGLVFTKMAVAYFCLVAGFEVFTLPICYLACDIPYAAMVVWQIKKKRLLKSTTCKRYMEDV